MVKERARGIYNTLPYTRLLKLITIELLQFVVMWLNSFPVASGVSTQFSPREFILCHKLDAKLHCHAPFGAYCKVHDNNDVTNTLQGHTHPVICLGPTGNLQGNYKFLLLDTGKRILCRNFTELPLTTSIQKQVEMMAQAENHQAGLHFVNHSGNAYGFPNNSLDDPVVNDPIPALFPDILAEMPGVLSTDKDTPTPMTTEPHVTWQDLAQAAAANSGIDTTPLTLPKTALEIIEIDDDDDGDAAILPNYTFPPPKLEPDVVPPVDPVEPIQPHLPPRVPPADTPAVTPAPSLRRSGQTRMALEQFKPFHLYTTVADNEPGKYVYVDTMGQIVDHSLPEHQLALVCHHMFISTAEKVALATPPHRKQGKQLGLKKELKFSGCGVPTPFFRK